MADAGRQAPAIDFNLILRIDAEGVHPLLQYQRHIRHIGEGVGEGAGAVALFRCVGHVAEVDTRQQRMFRRAGVEFGLQVIIGGNAFIILDGDAGIIGEDPLLVGRKAGVTRLAVEGDIVVDFVLELIANTPLFLLEVIKTGIAAINRRRAD
ncbi:hypothetical protein D3C86_1608700 [compost metagenome]